LQSDSVPKIEKRTLYRTSFYRFVNPGVIIKNDFAGRSSTQVWGETAGVVREPGFGQALMA
jgi:hypothetical protein